MAAFKPAYEFAMKWEGGYVNDPDDRGGETYKGLSRPANPGWEGWKIIDSLKPLKKGAKIENKALNESHYNWSKSHFWDSQNYGLLNSQEVANACFDFGVWASGHNKTALKTISQMTGKTFSKWNKEAIKAINAQNPGEFLKLLFQNRKDFYTAIVEKNPSQQKFIKGWNNRLKSLADFVGVHYKEIAGGGLAFVFLIISAFYLYNRNK